ncbi:MAG: bifunctional lysylphosphatidylglycerol flippase/synthetase MprF [Gemmatimonadales bacterium]
MTGIETAPVPPGEPGTPSSDRFERVRRWLGPVAVLAVLTLALELLRRRPFHLAEVLRQAHQVSPGQLLEAFGLTGLAYLVLGGYDLLGLRYAGRPLSSGRTALASFIAYGLSQTLGFPLLTGGSVRARLWSAWGLSSEEIAQAIAFVSVMFLVGVAAVGGVVLATEPSVLIRAGSGGADAGRVLGGALLAFVVGYLGWSVLAQGRTVRVGWWEFRVPVPRLAAAQILVAVLDWVVAASVFAVLLPDRGGLSLPAVIGVFLVAQVAGLASHIPGGLGVFESVMVALLAPALPAATVLGTLVVYRGIYYLAPFGAALALLGIREALVHRPLLTRTAGSVVRVWTPLVPTFFGATVFLAGAILLVSGATPGVHSRLRWLNGVLPLGIIELSHFTASVTGAALIVLARGLTRRLDAAWGATVVLLGVGIVGSLLKGLDWEEATALGLVLVALLPARRAFYRKAAVLAEPWSPAWIAALAAVVGLTVWVTHLAYRHLAFTTDLWWRFVLRGDAPRSARAAAGVAIVFGVAGLWRLLRPARSVAEPPRPDALERAGVLLARSADASAQLVWLGDKSLLFSERENAFLMYAVAGRSWIAMGDPVGPPSEQAELVWRFRELVDRHGGWPVFYEVKPQHLPLYLDLGLSLLKLGEEATVPLAEFSLDGPTRRGLRRTARQMKRLGVVFELLPVGGCDAVMAELRAVSDAWLATRATREKGFSLGRFDPGYLRRFPVAVLRLDGRIVAFANVWTTRSGGELSIDLMRSGQDAPSGAMDYLFTELMAWGRAQGYASFVLGMAPLAGLERHPLAPLWNRLGGMLFERGEPFYHFQGLRTYKEKFDPVWEPRYLASPGGLALPRILANVTSLISGGLRGIVAK